jgi:hypothetical protein
VNLLGGPGQFAKRARSIPIGLNAKWIGVLSFQVFGYFIELRGNVVIRQTQNRLFVFTARFAHVAFSYSVLIISL